MVACAALTGSTPEACTWVASYRSPFGLVLATATVGWCTFAASTMFVTVLQMSNQRLLVAYPVGLLYSSFALLTVF